MTTLCDLLMILEAFILYLSLDTLRIFSILRRVVLLVFFECFPESVRERSRVCVVF